MSDTLAAGISQNESVNENAVDIYPNPASDGRFTILLKDMSAHAVVRIYDNQGRMQGSTLLQ